MQDIPEILKRLKSQPFRARFKLKNKELDIVEEKGLEMIHEHAIDILTKRIAAAEPKNDGKQTPFRGHPVFIAQHATATCCRGCFFKWYKVPKGRELTKEEIAYAADVIVAWIEVQNKSSTQI